MEAQVTVSYGGKRKLVKIDRGNLESTRGAFKRKFSQLDDNFILQATKAGEDDPFDIEDEEDFSDHSDASTFIVRDQGAAAAMANERQRSSSAMADPPLPVTVEYGNKKKRVSFNMEDFQMTRDNIHSKFADLEDDFQLFAKSPESDDLCDIDDAGDLNDHRDAKIFYAKSKTACQSQPTLANVTVVCGTDCKVLTIDKGSLQNTRCIIRENFKVAHDFLLFVLSPESNSQFEVKEDGDLQTHRDAQAFIIKPNFSNEPTGAKEEKTAPGPPPPYSAFSPTSESQAPGVKDLINRFSRDLQVQAPSLGPSTSTAVMLPQRNVAAELLENLPGVDTKIVKDSIIELQADVDIPAIVEKMDILGDCLRLASYGVEASENLEIVKKVQELHTVGLKLCNESDQTMIHCKTTANDILNILQIAWGYLSDGHTKKANEKLNAISELAAGMKTKSGEAKDRFTEATKTVTDTIASITEERQSVSEAPDSASGGGESEPAQDEPAPKLDIGDRIKIFFTTLFTRDRQSAESEKVRKLLRERHLQRTEEGVEDNIRLLSYAERMQSTSADVAKTDVTMATAALHATLTALKSLHSCFAKTEKFWYNMQMHCDRVACNQPNRQSSQTQQQPGDFWNSKGFEVEAKREFARFMALRQLCKEFRTQMAPIEAKIHNSIQDHPTPQQARAKVKEMTAAFQKKIEANIEKWQEEKQDDPYANFLNESTDVADVTDVEVEVHHTESTDDEQGGKEEEHVGVGTVPVSSASTI